MTEGLRPAVVRPIVKRKRPGLGAYAVALAIAVHAGAMVVAVPGPPPPPAPAAPPIVVSLPAIVPPIVVPIETPAPAPVAPASRASCPPPRRDADWVKPDLPDPIEHVQPAPTNAGWIAAWSRTTVYVSTDAGATFARVLDGEQPVIGVSFDCFGRAIALRGTSVGILDGGREHWATVPGLRALDTSDGVGAPGGVLGGGPDVVVVGVAPGDFWRPRLVVSADAGATWTRRDLAGDLEPGMKMRGRQDADGTIRVGTAVGDCMNDVLEWTTITGGKPSTVTAGMPEMGAFAIYGDVAVTEDSVVDAGGNATPIDKSDVDGELEPVPGAIPTVVSGTRAFRVSHAKLRELSLYVDGHPEAVDPAGRLWSVACGHAVVARKTRSEWAHDCDGPDI